MAKDDVFLRVYIIMYILLILAEMVFVIIIWSPYGDPEGRFGKLYDWVKKRLNGFVVASIFVLTFISFIFPGLGFFALLILLYRVAEKCCNKENFGDGLLFGWGQYEPDKNTVYDQGYLDRTTCSAFSSSDGDQNDPYFLFPMDSENWIIPKIVNQVDIPKKCSLKYVGSVFQESIKPRGLYTTSLLAKQLHER